MYISLIFSLFSSSKTNVGRFKLHEFCFEITDGLALQPLFFLSKALKGTEKQREWQWMILVVIHANKTKWKALQVPLAKSFAKILRQGVTPPTHHNSLSHSYGFFTYDFFFFLLFGLSTFYPTLLIKLLINFLKREILEDLLYLFHFLLSIFGLIQVTNFPHHI